MSLENATPVVYLTADLPNLEWPEAIGSRETIQRGGWPLIIVCSSQEDASQLADTLNTSLGYSAIAGEVTTIGTGDDSFPLYTPHPFTSKVSSQGIPR